MLLRKRPHLRKVFQRDRDTQRMRDAVVRHFGERMRHVGRELREIEMAMRIDELRHAATEGLPKSSRYASSTSSTNSRALSGCSALRCSFTISRWNLSTARGAAAAE